MTTMILCIIQQNLIHIITVFLFLFKVNRLTITTAPWTCFSIINGWYVHNSVVYVKFALFAVTEFAYIVALFFFAASVALTT